MIFCTEWIIFCTDFMRRRPFKMASEHKRKPQEDQEGPTEPKKTCTPNDDNNIFVNFPGNYIRRLANICEHSICHSGVDPINVLKLRPLVFMRCNAADSTPFSEAYCKVSQLRDRTNNKRQVFGSIFRKGLDILLGYCKNRTIPDDPQERLVLEKLLRYLVNEEIQSPLLDLAEFEDTDPSIVLANHLFGQLSLTPKHVIDKNSAGKKTKCPCSQSCGMPCNFGDTSIGNEEVWHGNLDVIINHDVVLSNPLIDESDSPGKASGEVKASILPRNNQTIAQSVVFSFLQKQGHPGKHALRPCIGVAHNDLIIYFYDSEYDVLLESSLIPLRPDSGITPHTKLSTTAIIISWLVMNHRFLCSGLPDDLKSNAAAEFFEQANGKLEVYRGSLRLGNIESLSYAYSDDSDEEVETPAYLSDVRSEFYAISRASLNNRYQYS